MSNVGDYGESRYELLMSSWDWPSLEKIRALKKSDEWQGVPEDEKEMYDIMEECMSRPEALATEEWPAYGSVVEVKPINMHGTFG